MKKKKMLLFSMVVAIMLVAVGWAAVHFGISLVFDKYVLGTALSSIAEKETDSATQKEGLAKPVTTVQDGEKTEENDKQTASSTPAETKRRLSNTEIISRVMGSSELTYKMASMVSYEDKKRVVSIVLSNFTADELSEIAKNVKGGIASDYKSRMISEARSRLTGEQWQECLNIAYKYIDQIRPYVE